MNCSDLAGRIEGLQPDAHPRDVARLCLLLMNLSGDLDLLEDVDELTSAWSDVGLRLQAATDQHAAMTEELHTLTAADIEDFCTDQVDVLIRVIKVQSQVLQLYVGQSCLR